MTTRMTVRIIPNASRSEVAGQEGSVWKIRIAAPPIDGKANEALLRFLADRLQLSISELVLLKGHASKIKILEIPLSREEIFARLKT